MAGLWLAATLQVFAATEVAAAEADVKLVRDSLLEGRRPCTVFD